jgi:hypothetical protein
MLDPSSGWTERGALSLPSPLVATRTLRLDRHSGCAVLLEDGTVWWAAATL